MEKTLEFPDLLRLIDERSTAFRAAVSAAPSLDEQVPTCPEWTLFDLVQHLGEGRRRWAATVAAGPAAAPPARSGSEGAPAAPREREALLAWLAASTQQLLDALREAGKQIRKRRGSASSRRRNERECSGGPAAPLQKTGIGFNDQPAALDGLLRSGQKSRRMVEGRRWEVFFYLHGNFRRSEPIKYSQRRRKAIVTASTLGLGLGTGFARAD